MLQSSQGWLGKDSLPSLLMSLLAVDQKSLADPFHVRLCRGQFSARQLVSSEQASWEEKQRKEKQDVSPSWVLYNSVWEVTSCASCSILFIRGRSLVRPTLKGRGLHKGIWIQEYIRCILGSLGAMPGVAGYVRVPGSISWPHIYTTFFCIALIKNETYFYLFLPVSPSLSLSWIWIQSGRQHLCPYLLFFLDFFLPHPYW